MKLKKFNEMRKWNSNLKNYYVVDNPLATVGQLIKYLEKYDPNTKVAINVDEDPSEIIEIKETVVSQCTGKGDSLERTADWDPDEKVILIIGNQY